MHIQIIVGSIRRGRNALAIAEWAQAVAAEHQEITTEIVDLREWKLPMYDLPKPPIIGDYEDPLQRRWADQIARGDGFVFVSPEYNHGYTAVLKNALDYLYAEWVDKPAGFIAYGVNGGERAIEQLRLVLLELRMSPLRDAVHIPDLFDLLEDGRFKGAEHHTRQMHRVFDGLVKWGVRRP
ncbi:hypothetical protein KBTX_01661 [wastewater metagenome]|uniref:NADPH-dependent FMN reductase-like domain-containing protein n=2 Tax=unclassified sequences TaxID=12908 RepID=A0A5B8R9S8_9ZZZZ|nr:NAD(P)H-dependent oxidoreductase [Arhodomonas sp. KWT]QEA05341.1 hypothetical protein KBTEX_01661 [uncultured organism]